MLPTSRQWVLKMIEDVTARRGPDHPMIKHLKRQLADGDQKDPKLQTYYASSVRHPAPEVVPKNLLPNAPSRDQFKTDEAFEEARGRWFETVGRIRAMADRAAKPPIATDP